MTTLLDKDSTSKSTNKPTISKLWYKNYMVWVFVIGFPLFMVITCLWFVYYSIEVKDSVVRDDWYMDGKTLYADVSKDKLAHDMGLSGTMTIHNELVNFKLNAPTNSHYKPTNQLNVEISHATQITKDRDFIISLSNDGSYQGTVQLDPNKGKYYIVIHDPSNSWRLRSVQELPTMKPMSFKPLTAFDTKK